MALELSVFQEGEDDIDPRPGFESLVVKLQCKPSEGENPYDSRSPQYALFEAFRPENRGNHALYRLAISKCLFYSMNMRNVCNPNQ